MKMGKKIGWAVLLLLLVLLHLEGIRAFTVLSGSMEPAYPVGSLILVKPVDGDMLQAGDVITFRQPGGAIVTHRIISREQGRFRTKGDANAIADGGSVSAHAILGSPFLWVPYLGFYVSWLQRPPGNLLLLLGLALLLLPVRKGQNTGP